jgi:hypothetical protein
MRRAMLISATVLVTILSVPEARSAPLRVYGENPRYLERGGVPIVLFGSGEWGIISDASVDIAEHNEWYAECGANANRASLFAFCVREGRDDLLAPWPRVGPGVARDGGPRFDLDQWDEAFWARLHAYLSDCQDRGIVVLLQIFDEPYTEGNPERWGLNPFNPENNINAIPGMPDGDGSAEEAFYDPTNAELMAIQDALVTRLLDETAARYDNVIYEIGNEINMDSVTALAEEWQDHWLDLFERYHAEHPGVEPLLTNDTRGSLMESGRGRWGVLNHHGLVSLNFVRTSPADMAREVARQIDEHHGFYGVPVLNSRPASDPDRTDYPDIVSEDQGRAIYLTYLLGGGHVVGFRTTIGSWQGGRAAERIIQTTRTLADRLPLFSMAPRHELVDGRGALCSVGGGCVAVYLPEGGAAEVNLDATGLGKEWDLLRYDPREMTFQEMGAVEGSSITLESPGEGVGQDWVFILTAR